MLNQFCCLYSGKATYLYGVALFCIAILSACAGGGVEKGDNKGKVIKTPDKVSIPRDTMISILIDIHLAETMAQQLRRNRDSTTKSNIREYYQTIFKQHRVAEQEFKDAFLYYSKNIEDFNKMYEEIQIRLSKMEEEAKAN